MEMPSEHGGQNWRFWALIPGEPVQAEITAFKREAADLFHSFRALRSPAHITVIPPLSLGLEDARSIDRVISAVHMRQDPFSVVCHGFASFPHRVLYVDIPENKCLGDYAEQIRVKLDADWPELSLRSRPFRPHMTVAFRDLTEDAFLEGRKHFADRTYHRQWVADGLWRLDYHEAQWVQSVFLPFYGVSGSDVIGEDHPANKASL